jgi:hypothetical protein
MSKKDTKSKEEVKILSAMADILKPDPEDLSNEEIDSYINSGAKAVNADLEALPSAESLFDKTELKRV